MFSNKVKNSRVPQKLIAEIMKEKKSLNTELFSVKYIKNNENKVRFATTASKKNFKTAVLRNKIKRWFREVIRENKNNLSKNKDYVFIAKKEINKSTFQDFKKIFINLISKNSL